MAPVSTERDLRLDLFRGLALWLIFLDHIPSNVVSWITIRNYGFSDATEIFVFISGYTAAFVYGRAMREHGFVVGSARILKRAWQIYVAHIFLFVIYLAEIAYVARSFDNPLYNEEMGMLDFLQASGRHADAGAAAEVQAGQHGRAAALHRAAARFPPVLWLLLRAPTLALAASALLYALTLAVRLEHAGLSERHLGVQSVRLAAAVRVRRLVRARRRTAAWRPGSIRRSCWRSRSPICCSPSVIAMTWYFRGSASSCRNRSPN